MEAAQSPRRGEQGTTASSRRDPSHRPHDHESVATTRVDERCPVRYYPLFALVARRRVPIRYC